jgi:hypothetical protein
MREDGWPVSRSRPCDYRDGLAPAYSNLFLANPARSTTAIEAGHLSSLAERSHRDDRGGDFGKQIGQRNQT